MPTISHVVEKYIRSNPILHSCLLKDIISFHRLAKYIRKDIEKELGKEVEENAIVMALSRLRDKLIEKEENIKQNTSIKNVELSLKSDIVLIDVKKTEQTMQKMQKIQQICGWEESDVFSLTQSIHEITIISQKKYLKQMLKILDEEKKLNLEENLSAIVLKFGKEILYQPGFFDRVIRELSWENINIYQIVSTLTELIIIIKDKDATKAYDVVFKNLKN
jgi:aspartokinase